MEIKRTLLSDTYVKITLLGRGPWGTMVPREGSRRFLKADPLWPRMGPLKHSTFSSDLEWARPPILWTLQTPHGRSGPVRAALTFTGGQLVDTESPVADIGGSLVVTGRPVTDKVGPPAVTRSPLAGTGGPLANTGDPLADTPGQAK